jgi:hypothetical protein
MFQPLDLVTFAGFKREKQEIDIDRPVRSQICCIAKLMKAPERAMDSRNNRVGLRVAGLQMNPRVFPPVASAHSVKLNEMIDWSTRTECAEGDEGIGELGNQLGNRPIPVFGFLNADHFPAE